MAHGNPEIEQAPATAECVGALSNRSLPIFSKTEEETLLILPSNIVFLEAREDLAQLVSLIQNRASFNRLSLFLTASRRAQRQQSLDTLNTDIQSLVLKILNRAIDTRDREINLTRDLLAANLRGGELLPARSRLLEHFRELEAPIEFLILDNRANHLYQNLGDRILDMFTAEVHLRSIRSESETEL